MNDLKFDIYALVEPKTPADIEAVCNEIALEMETLREYLELLNEQIKRGKA